MIGSPPSSLPDLRRASLANLRTIDLRGPERDFWADEAAIRDRFVATWAGLADEAWSLPGAAPSDAGGPDWSLAEHVGHVADWQELAIDYIGVALETGRWPSDDDYDGGDFDTYNERRREPWASMAPIGDPRTPRRRTRAPPGASPGPFDRDDPQRRGLGLGVHGPARPSARSPRGHRAVGRGAAPASGGRRPVRRGPAPARLRDVLGRGSRDPGRAPRPARAGAAGGLDEHRAHAGLDAARPRRAPRRLGRGGRSRRRRRTGEPDRGRPTRRRGSTPGTSDMSLRRRRRPTPRSSPASTGSTTGCAQRPGR